MKFGRNYKIQILPPGGELVTIQPPFSVTFKVDRNTLASANKAKLTIINLGPKTRQKLYKDRYTFAEYWQLVILSGYGDRLERVFQGNIYECTSFKQGTEWNTVIDAFDGLNGITNGYTSTTVNKNTDKKTVIKSIIKDMPNIIQGVLGDPTEGSGSDRGQVLLGNSSQVLTEETAGQYFIDNETLNVISDQEVLAGPPVLILDSKQLFSTPKRRETFLDCEILFTPNAQIGQFCEIRSSEKIYNSQYKVVGFSHDFVYSGASGGVSKTMLSLYAGAGGLKGVF